MPKYLLLMRGDQSRFMALPAEGKRRVIADHEAWSRELAEAGHMVDGDGLAFDSVLLTREAAGIVEKANPHVGDPRQLSGFYIIEARDDAAALSLARGCPALGHGESVEVSRLGH